MNHFIERVVAKLTSVTLKEGEGLGTATGFAAQETAALSHEMEAVASCGLKQGVREEEMLLCVVLNGQLTMEQNGAVTEVCAHQELTQENVPLEVSMCDSIQDDCQGLTEVFLW